MKHQREASNWRRATRFGNAVSRGTAGGAPTQVKMIALDPCVYNEAATNPQEYLSEQ